MRRPEQCTKLGNQKRRPSRTASGRSHKGSTHADGLHAWPGSAEGRATILPPSRKMADWCLYRGHLFTWAAQAGSWGPLTNEVAL